MTKLLQGYCQAMVYPSDRGSGYYGDAPHGCERRVKMGVKYCWQHGGKMKTKHSEQQPLEPVDLKRCQTDHRDYNPFRLGPVVKVTRCDGKAKYVITEAKPGADGRKGAMSVCDNCLTVFKAQPKQPKVIIQPIVRKAKTTHTLALGDPL